MRASVHTGDNKIRLVGVALYATRGAADLVAKDPSCPCAPRKTRMSKLGASPRTQEGSAGEAPLDPQVWLLRPRSRHHREETPDSSPATLKTSEGPA